MEDIAQLVSPRFPEGLRVLLVDDDLVCLDNMNQMLEECRYQVTKFSRVDDALTLLRAKTNKFDIMIADVRISEPLLEYAIQMDMPVILMSASDKEDMNRIINGVARGAYYLAKPVPMRTLRSIWQHVVRKMKHLWKNLEANLTKVPLDYDRLEKSSETSDSNSKSSTTEKKANQNDDDDNNRVNVHEPPELDQQFIPPIKKARVVWSAELHQKFVAAVGKLGIDKAVPKKILEAMNVPELSRENVASHLQKYRLFLRRQETQVKPDSTNLQTSYQVADKSNVTHEYNAKQQQHVIAQQQMNVNVNMHGGTVSSYFGYFGGSQQFSMIQSRFGDLILSHVSNSATTSNASVASTIRTDAGTVGSTVMMNRFPRMSNYHSNNEMSLPSLHVNESVASYRDPAYNTFSHITSDFQNSVVDDYHHHENSMLPNFHVGEEPENLVGPVVDNPMSESLLMVSQFYRDHPQWNQSYSPEEMQ